MKMQNSGGGNPMSAAQLARLQQQLAQQYRQGQPGQQQQMMNATNALGGMGNPQQQQQQQLQQAFMQQQQQQQVQQMQPHQLQNNQSQQGMAARRNSQLAGMGNTSAAALAMMQQQQQQQQQAVAGNSQMANANMSSYWNALQNQGSGGGGGGGGGGAMDASSASSAQLAALAGMNMGAGAGTGQANNANMQALLGGRGGGNKQHQGMGSPQDQMRMGQQQQSQQGGQGGGDSGNQNAMLLQQQIAQLQRQLQQQQQTQQPQQQGGNSVMDRRGSAGGSGNFQLQNQQQLFQQMQQQQQQQQRTSSTNMLQQMAGGMIGQDAQQAMGMAAQLQQQNKPGNDQFSSMNAMMQGQNAASQMQNVQQNLRNSISGQNVQGIIGQGGRGSMNEQDLLLQQQQLLRSSGLNQNMSQDAKKAQEMLLLQQRQQQQQQQQQQFGMQQNQLQQVNDPMSMGTSVNSLSQQQNMQQNNAFNLSSFDMDGSLSGSRGGSGNRQANKDKVNQPGQQNQPGQLPDVTSSIQGDILEDPTSSQKSFLDGSFAGGWQSNADLPDRRRIIFSILEVIRQMRPDTNKISQKLPHMAKSLEEHLYRSAQTKEEYLDPTTLKKRLQLIAHGLELHRSTSSGSVHSATSQGMGNNNSGSMNSDAQQLQQLLQMQGQGMGGDHSQRSLQGSLSGNSVPGLVGVSAGGNQNIVQADLLVGLGGSMSGKMNDGGDASGGFQDPIAAQKKKVIRQQHQRLLLLRHASKCKEGPNCKTKFCGQMMTLWKHMKKCRDKNCKTSHCLSSRCVLNHYRICKSQGRTATCEVCGPVMEQIKRQDQGEGMDSSDPLAAKPDPDLPNNALPLQRQTSNFSQSSGGGGGGSVGGQQNNAQQQMQQMQQLFQQQQAAQQQGGGMQNQNPQQLQLQALQQQQALRQQQQQGGLGGMASLQQDNSQGSGNGDGSNDPQQVQQLQAAQQKLYQQQQVLKQLQKQQAQLLEQQKQLQEQQQHLKDPTTQQGQQLQQQHALLQQLQMRCQQQQTLIQQELVMQMKALQQAGQNPQALAGNNQVMGNNSQGSQHSQHSRSGSVGTHNSQNQNQGQNQNMQNQNMQNQNMMNQNMQNQNMQNQNMQNQNMQNQNMQNQNMQNQNMMNQNMQGQNMQGNRLEAQMQALSASHLQALNNGTGGGMNDNSNNSGNNQMSGQNGNNLQDAMQSGNFNQMQQVLQAQHGNDGMQAGNQGMPQQQQQGSGQPGSGPSSPGNSSKNAQQESGKDGKAGGGAKRRASKNTRPQAPAGGRGKGPRGRGGKGKRLRDMADDLGAQKGANGASINKSSSEATSKKRTANDLDDSSDPAEGGDKGQQSNKLAKVDGAEGDSKASGGDATPAEGEEKTSKQGDGEQNASLTSSMSKGDVEQHLESLHKGLHLTSRTITHKCLPIVQQLIDDPFGWVFRDAVDPVVFGLPDYFEVVKNPMHLLLVKKKLENAVYTDMASFERDVKLVFENAILYNGEDSEVGQLAKTMISLFEKEYKKLFEEIKNDILNVELAGNACKLCGTQNRLFESTKLFCSGTCGMQLIPRNASYYTDHSKQNCWCKSCYSRVSDNETLVLDDGTEITKRDLQSAKNDAVHEESWVQCDDCKCWVHQICALFNGRKNKTSSAYACPKCTIKNKPDGEKAVKLMKTAEDLPRCKTSDAIESGLKKALEDSYHEKAVSLGVGVDQIEKAKGLTVRVVSHIEKKHVVRDLMHEKYEKNGCPNEFPVRTKCISLFQSIDGIDVLVFAMFVYEYGHDCPAPNRRRVYISYLDSVQYFEPKSLRTTAYHAVLVEYLRFVKERGFHTAHIWSCPPTPDDDYIFHCHPKHQQIPRDDMLRSWYIQMLDKARAEGIVLEVNNIHEEYFKNNGSNAPTGDAVNPTCLPYFEGDYIPGEIENIVAQVKEEESRADYVETFSSAPRPPGGKLGTRSNPGKLLNQYQDKVMLRLGKALSNMKENFLVVHLRSKKFVAAVERGEDVSNWTEGDDEGGKPRILGKDSSVLHPRAKQSRGKEGQNAEEDDPQAPASQSKGLDEIRPALAKHFAQMKSKKIGSTIDEDDIMECDIFEARQPFLNFCQSNRYQFEELRKAKHTTMMVLFQLHNPMAPKFVQQCAACRREIAHGIRYHCKVCASFDLCQSCFPSAMADDSKLTHDKNHAFARIKMDPEGQKSQEERVRSLKPHLELIDHAANCEGAPACKLNNCDKMKKLFIHVQTCEVTYQRGCRKCSRLLGLLTVHARSCTVRGTCPLPFCDRIRERNERVRRQQQLMDDRRRQAQNELYRAGDRN